MMSSHTKVRYEINSPVVFFVHQMVAGAEGYKTSVIGWSRDRDGASTTHVSVAQLVG